jgi:hypothetical protein
VQQDEPVVVEVVQKGRYQLLRISEDVRLNSDISPVYGIVEQLVADGKLHIAFSFTPQSFLYTRHIAVLIKCLELVRDGHGSIAIVRPNEDIREVLSLIDQESMILQVESEETLLSSTSAV